jgi:Flp pilus assembly protein TadD
VASIAGGDGDAAVVRLHQVLTLADPRQRHRIRLVLARAYLVDSRNCRTGVSLLSDILRDDPRDAEALTLLGTFFRREGLLARAEVLLARAVLADPGNARARSDLREVRLALQRRREPAPTPGEGRGLVARLLSAR